MFLNKHTNYDANDYGQELGIEALAGAAATSIGRCDAV
jgi:hypothetical protein